MYVDMRNQSCYLLFLFFLTLFVFVTPIQFTLTCFSLPFYANKYVHFTLHNEICYNSIDWSWEKLPEKLQKHAKNTVQNDSASLTTKITSKNNFEKNFLALDFLSKCSRKRQFSQARFRNRFGEFFIP